MTLGEKIKQARLEAGLSQRQLCGETVTRNMLSQIENGAARPSMATLSYFAARLGKPVSYFLDEAAFELPSLSRLEQGRQEAGKQQLEDALRRTAAACYAAEGFYPPSVAYMVAHYGLQYDESRYIIHYAVFASNVMPDITVLKK